RRLEQPLGLELRLVGFDEVAGLSHADVLVSTVPGPAQPGLAGGDPSLFGRLAGLAPVTFDVSYQPRRTPLLGAAMQTGNTVIEGLELLLRQAARQVELMTGVRPAPLAAMRIAGVAALEATAL
ncbi:MAG: shikimate dehydrogenase, partial [Acidimicrobiales bacterium]